MSTTTTTATGEPFTMPDLQAMKAALLNAPPRQWMLVAPDGRMWITSKPEELFVVLAEKDALLRQALDALEGFTNITNDSQGVKGYHMNGDIAEWDEFDEVDAASSAIEAIRNHLRVKND